MRRRREKAFLAVADGRPFWPLGGLFSVFNVKCVGDATSESDSDSDGEGEGEGDRADQGATGRMRNASDNDS